MPELKVTLTLKDTMSDKLNRVVSKTKAAAAKMSAAYHSVTKAAFSLKSMLLMVGGAAVIRSFVQTAAASDQFKDRVTALTKQWEDFKIKVLQAGVFEWIEGGLKSVIASFSGSKDAVRSTADAIVAALSIIGYITGGIADGLQMIRQGWAWFRTGVDYAILGLKKLSQTVAGWLASAVDAWAWLAEKLGDPKEAARARETVATLRGTVDVLKAEVTEQAKVAEKSYLTADALSAQKAAHEEIYKRVADLNAAYEEGKNALDGQVAAAKEIATALPAASFGEAFALREQYGEMGGQVGDGPWYGEAEAPGVAAQRRAGIGKAVGSAGKAVTQGTLAQAAEAHAAAIRNQNEALERQKALYDQIHDKVSSVISIIGNAFMNYMDDLLENKVKPMRDYFKDMLKDFARWLMQMAMQRAATAVTNALVGVAGGVGAAAGGAVAAGAAGRGGILPSPSYSIPIRAYAGGGMTPHVTNGPELWMVGERNHGRDREAVVPLEGNRSIPVQLKGGAGGNVVNNYYNISTTDSASFEEYLTTNRRAVRIANNRNLREHPGSRV